MDVGLGGKGHVLRGFDADGVGNENTLISCCYQSIGDLIRPENYIDSWHVCLPNGFLQRCLRSVCKFGILVK